MTSKPMKQRISTTPRNSIVLLMDHSNARIPEAASNSVVTSTESCIAIGTLCEVDGPTTITLTTEPEDAGGCHPLFTGHLSVPSGRLSLFDVGMHELISLRLTEATAHVTVLANDDSEPDSIIIIVEQSTPSSNLAVPA